MRMRKTMIRKQSLVMSPFRSHLVTSLGTCLGAKEKRDLFYSVYGMNHVYYPSSIFIAINPLGTKPLYWINGTSKEDTRFLICHFVVCVLLFS